MSEEIFYFTKSSSIVIYGGNQNGINFYRQLISAGYNVQAFVDRKAKEWNYKLVIDGTETTIYEPEEFIKTDKDIVVFIAIRNAIEQNNVAQMLWKNGFQNVIYFPLHKGNVQTARQFHCLKLFYQDFADKKMVKDAILPKQSALLKKDLFQDHAMIRQDGEYVTAWMPISLIHYYSEEYYEKMVCVEGISPDNKGTIKKYIDRSIFQLDWLKELFDFFVNGKGDLVYYWEIEKEISNYIKQQSNRENQLWFTDRQKCAEMMLTEMNAGTDFSSRFAIPVQWNSKGYFNICDGSHRLAFLNCLNMNRIPVQTRLDDYKKWVNKGDLEKLLAYIKEKRITVFETPIPHPWFYECEIEEEKFGNTILKHILEQLMKLGLYADFSVLDINPKDVYYLQHFARVGAKEVTGIIYDKKQQDFLTYLNQLFYMKECINLVQEDEEKQSDRKYDIVLLFKKLCTLKEKEQIRYVEWIATKAERLIIWESGVEYEKEKQLILKYIKCEKYIFLKRVLSENVVHEVGIFVKN